MKRLSGKERRHQIVEAAHAVILQKGLAATATRDVTRQLGVGSGLLHHYFSTWADLRAEVVRSFIAKEIMALEAELSDVPAENLIAHFIDWMASDPEFRFWGLWLDAIEEARRDAELAQIIEDGHIQWHAAIVEVINRSVAAGLGECQSPAQAAWRISALIDGLMGMLVLGRATLSPRMVKELLHQQIAMELRPAPLPVT